MQRKKKLIYINTTGGSVEFSTDSVYHVNISLDVEGLSDIPVKYQMNSSTGQDGATCLSYQLEPRNIIISGYINNNNKTTAAELHERLLQVLNPALAGMLIFDAPGCRRVIDCKLSPTFPPVPVLKKFVIAFECPVPLWRDEHETRVDMASWVGCLHFPVAICPNGKTEWKIGRREASLMRNVNNEGDWACGMRVEIRARGTLTNPKIINVRTGQFMYLHRNFEMVTGDRLVINTQYGQKEVKLIRGDDVIDAMDHWHIDSTFIQLAPGGNLFKYEAETGDSNLEASFYHNNYYLGVA